MWGLGMGLGGLVMLLFWGALIVGLVLLIRSLDGRERGPRGETALDVLKRRYAAGEITREQFEQTRRDIDS
ncbi:MAG: SHOCT domain-containing protein [Acidobacteria bacterium]|nr:SHOCT domain-containing protein [Acidobacteriota bacterium]